MDILVIAKKSFNRSDTPHVIYCGQSRDEAAAAVKATAGQYARYYFADPEPHIPIRCPEASAPHALALDPALNLSGESKSKSKDQEQETNPAPAKPVVPAAPKKK